MLNDFYRVLCDFLEIVRVYMEQTWGCMSKKLHEGILNAVTGLNFEQMTPVQVISGFIALSHAVSCV